MGELGTFGLELFLLVLTAGCGLPFIARLRWSPVEKLCGGVGLSLVLIYLASATVYLLKLPTSSYWVISAIAGVLTLSSWRQWRILLRDRQVRFLLGAFGALLLWTLLLLAMTRSYSGGNWSGDWIEHYERTDFFLNHKPFDTQFIGMYALPARPPMMNVLGAWICAQVGLRFDVLQVAFAFWNLLLFLPCWLIAKTLSRRGISPAAGIVLLSLFAFSPVFMVNVTYLWTKGLAGFFVILGTWFYLRAWKRNDAVRMSAAALALAAGIVVHYSVGPYAAFLALHYAVAVLWKRTGRWKEIALAAAAAILLIGSWVAWSASVYGLKTTLASNTTVSDSSKMGLGENFAKIGGNLIYSVVPHPLHVPYSDFAANFAQPSQLGVLRDHTFLIQQTTMIVGIGFIAGFVVLVLAIRELWHRHNPLRNFWVAFVLVTGFLTIATHPTLEPFGVAHVCSQPLIYLALVFLATKFIKLSAALKWLVMVGAMLDLVIGIYLHFGLQNWMPELANEQLVPKLMDNMPSITAVANSLGKLSLGYTFFGDHFEGGLLVMQGIALGFACILLYMWAEATLGKPLRALCYISSVAIAVVGGAMLIYSLQEQPVDLVVLSEANEAWIRTHQSEAYMMGAVESYADNDFNMAARMAQASAKLDPSDYRAGYILRLSLLMGAK